MRFALPRLDTRQPVDFEAHASLKFIGKAELLGIVARQRNNDRSFVTIADRDPGRRFDFARETGPQLLTFEREREELLFSRLGLYGGGEHPGRRPAGAASGLRPVVDGDRAAGLRQTPSNAQPHDSSADDDGFGVRRRYHGRRDDIGLPPPGTPDQVQWV